MFERISPEAAWDAMGAGDAIYVDVRTSSEFNNGHPEGAYHVPLMEHDPSTGAPGFNPGFVEQMRVLAASVAQSRPEAPPKLVIGCQMGGRSRQACELLTMQGLANLADCSAGWGGQRDGYGRSMVAGWSTLDLPSASVALDGRSWPDIKALSNAD
jgi:rhodanese-related sulfurtransferase